MDRIAVFRIRDGVAAPRVSDPDGFVLDTESEWAVEAESAIIAQVHGYLPPGTARRAGPLLLLWFRNSVGRLPAGPLGTLRVESGKWTELEFDQMLDDISAESAALPFAANNPLVLPYQREIGVSPIALHSLLWLRHAVAPPSRLIAALQQIIAAPERRLVRDTRTVQVELASNVSARSLEAMVAGRWPLQRAPRGLGIDGHLPTFIDDEHVKTSIDLPENRFVKQFLDQCERLVQHGLSLTARIKPSIARRVAIECAAITTALTPIRRASLWREIGVMSFLPLNSTVLHRREPYREVLRHHMLLNAVSRAVPLSAEDTLQLLAAKDITLLYELWTGFAVLRALRSLRGAPTKASEIQRDELGATLRWGLQATWRDGTEVAINATYTRKHGWHARSSSVQLRPDVVLRCPDASLHIFDAKFRVDDRGKPRIADLHKMHTYRDAIRDVASAWVLYPGARAYAYDDTGERWHGTSSNVPLRGVGVLPLVPGRPPDALVAVLARLLG